MGVARISFCDSAWSHPPQVNQNLLEVEPRNLVFKCFLSGSNDQARVGSPATCLPSSEAGSGGTWGTRLLPSASRTDRPRSSKGSSTVRLPIVIFHPPS